ncbi:SDR family NAD(P)-dependent oxidoreductase [Streptomyces gobiensis]|uniref:SDR family NAD(P)-dependent oxidoreductase n=1 Tax=Streptomyces gobiensis TaxID=2875706 RepID=UPI001E327242|nr:SDR family oxidoreductase [Streptomyces gobiensis]UGY94140.1 SDR family oxidoreductase [Streptomyces gobiensis]
MNPTGQALVVGGSRGIGAAIASALATEGWPTTIAARDSAQLERCRLQAAERGLKLSTARVDVTSQESVERLFGELTPRGELGVCVMAAGRNLSRRLLRPPRDAAEEWSAHDVGEWRDMVDLSLTGTFLVGRAAALSMARTGTRGVLIPIVSSTWQGSWGQSAYTAAKAGVVSLTRSWALELGEFGIRAVAIAPGVVDGAALREKCARNPAHARYMERLRQQVPLRRFAAEQEVAAAAVHVAANQYLTGTVLEVAGGGFPPRIH